MGKTNILEKKKVKHIILNGVKIKDGRRRKPSPRALLAVSKLAVNGGNKAKALRDAGFSESIANSPSKVFNAEPVQAIIKELYPRQKIFDAIDRNIVLGDLKQKYFDDEVSEDEIKEMFEQADIPLLKIFRKRKSDKTGWHKIAYYKVTNPDAQIRSAELGAKITGIIKTKSSEDEVAGKMLVDFMIKTLRTLDER